MQMSRILLRVCALPVLVLVSGCVHASTIAGTAIIGGQQVQWSAGSRIVTTIDPSDVTNYENVHGVPAAGYSGIAGLVIDRPEGQSICTGSLINSFQLITAAHCLADTSGNIVASSLQSVFFPEGGGTYVDTAASFLLHPDYSGAVFDDHDIAIINLGTEAPAGLDRYGLYFDNALGSGFEVVGFGRRGQGDTGSTIDAGLRRRGFNVFEALGIDLLPFLGINTADNIYLFDFDNGLAANDALGYWLGEQYAGLGLLYDLESNTAPGDSGGPSFVGGRIAAVTSFGLTFSASDPETGEIFSSDILAGLNSSFGEFAGSTSILENRPWLDTVVIPEPSAFILMGTGILAIGWLRRRHSGTRQ